VGMAAAPDTVTSGKARKGNDRLNALTPFKLFSARQDESLFPGL
jgi:hypothetical protein